MKRTALLVLPGPNAMAAEMVLEEATKAFVETLPVTETEPR